MINNQSISVHAFVRRKLTSLSVNKILLPRYVNWSTNFRGLPLSEEIVPSCLKHMNCVHAEANATGIRLSQVYLQSAQDDL